MRIAGKLIKIVPRIIKKVRNMDYKDDLTTNKEKHQMDTGENTIKKINGQLLYFDHERIRHMERMIDLFLTLFKRS